MKKRIAGCALCVVLVAGIFAGCGRQGGNETTPRETAPQVQTTVPVETTIPETTEYVPTVILDHVVINTPYGDLQYSDEWVDFMQTEQVMENDVVSVYFMAVINQLEYPLFTVIIGGEGDHPVCQMTDAEGAKHDVYVSVEEIGNTSALTESEENRLFAMQEEINYVIENIQ